MDVPPLFRDEFVMLGFDEFVGAVLYRHKPLPELEAARVRRAARLDGPNGKKHRENYREKNKIYRTQRLNGPDGPAYREARRESDRRYHRKKTTGPDAEAYRQAIRVKNARYAAARRERNRAMS